MAVSGTTAFDLDILEIIEEAYDQAEIDARTGYDMRSARRSLDLLFIEWGNKGYNLWTVVERTQPLTIGVGSYALQPDTIDLIEHGIDDNGRYSTMRRVPLATHAGRSDKTIQGKPSQIFIDRQGGAPVINIWPIPDKAYTLDYWVLRRINDTGNFTNTIDTPTRFLPALIASLAYKLSIKKNPGKADFLGKEAKRIWDEATTEDRERAPFQIYPDFS